MQTYLCPKGCCQIYVNSYTRDKKSLYKHKRYNRKAGVFIEDTINHKVLLIQSNGNLWGPPKGTTHIGETDLHCAVREVKEETGLDISHEDFIKAINIQNRAVYFYLQMEISPVKPTIIVDNDATGITWINPDCLEECIVNGNINLSQHCRVVFNHFHQRIFPTSTFLLVDRKRTPNRF